jgi:hypothetical protein
VGEEFECIDLLGFTVSSEQFFVEIDVPFGVYACCWILWGSFDGAVDAVVLEVFVDVAPIARDSRLGCPAVYVAAEWIRWVGKDVHRLLGDAL